MPRNNRLTIMMILGFLILFVSSVQPVDAHTLEWGLMPGSEFEFSANGNRKDIGVVDIDYSLTITAFEPIPVSPTFPGDFPRTTVSLENLADSTSLDMGGDISALCFSSFSAIPIGDWSSLSTIVEGFSGGVRDVVAFENTTHWGYSNNAEDATDRVLQTTIYLKDTGIMVSFTGYHWSFVTLDVIEDVTIKQIPAATSTTTTTGTTTGTTSTTTPPPSDPSGMSTAIMAISAVTIAVVGIAGISVMAKKRQSVDGVDAKVLVICPYCGKKTEQGITQCDKCGGAL